MIGFRLGALALLMCSTAALAGSPPPPPMQPQVDPTRPDWENPAVFARGKMAAHAEAFPFETTAKALARDKAASARFLSLDGDWQFHFSPDVDHLPTGFEQPDYDASSWRSIPVPSDWQAQGYDQARYNNITYPFPANRPLIPHDKDPVGSYRREVSLPASWSGSDVILHIGAAGSAYTVWVNGQKVGYSEDSKLPSDFDVTRFVHAGLNTVAIQVIRWSDGSYLEDQDFWRVSGIERSVWMAAAPKARIADHAVRAGLVANGAGALDLALNMTDAAKGMTLRATLRDGDTVVLTREAQVAGATVAIKADIPGVKPWTAETPNLYTLTYELIDKRGAVVQASAQRIGFRTIAIKDGVVTVNGRRITIRGVNRHEHDPVTFHVVSEASMRRDLELMKLANINAIRTSHYPNDERLYDLADEMGFYVMDEANIESHGYLLTGHPDEERVKVEIGHDPAWRAAQVSRVANMVARDKNHASVIFWSLGNESGVGANFEAAAKTAREMDPTRLISFLGWTQLNAPRPNAFVDIYAPMYDSPEQMAAYAQDKRFTQPMIQCEYAHMQGNSGGNLIDYWSTIYAHPGRLQGGFIWDWVEQTIDRTTPDGRKYWGDGGIFGPNPGGDIEFGDGLIQSDRTPNPQYFELAKVYAPFTISAVGEGHYRIINRRDFESLSNLSLEWVVTRDGAPFAHGDGPALTAKAGEAQDLAFNLPAMVDKDAHEYLLTLRVKAKAGAIAMVPEGHVLGWEQFALSAPGKPAIMASKGKITTTPAAITLSAGAGKLAVDRATGLVRYRVGEGPWMVGGAPNFYRAPTDNDLGTGTEAIQAPWKAMSEARKVESVTAQGDAVTVRFALGDGKASFAVTYRMGADGALALGADFRPIDKSLPAPTRVGLSFALPKAVDAMRWFGRGMHDSYVDRKTSAEIATWAAPVASQYHDFIRPQDTGNKLDVRWMEARQADSTGLRVAGDRPLAMTLLAFPYADLYRRAPGTWRSSDIQPTGPVTLLVDAVQAGVGGDTTWNAAGQPLAQYRTTLAPVTFDLVITPLTK